MRDNFCSNKKHDSFNRITGEVISRSLRPKASWVIKNYAHSDNNRLVCSDCKNDYMYTSSLRESDFLPLYEGEE